jgi:hypothetical protein
MPVALILIGAILIVVAFNNTMGQLATELQDDIPGFFVWGVAIAAILGLGYVPGLKQPSRWLLGLVVLVIVLTNYKQILTGFTSFAGSGGKATGTGAGAAPDPATAFSSSPQAPLPSAAQVGGDAGSGPTSGGGLPGVGATAGAMAGVLAGPIVGGGVGSWIGGMIGNLLGGAGNGGSLPGGDMIMNMAGGGAGGMSIDPSSFVSSFSSVGFGGLK